MSIRTTKNCVENLIAEGISASNIAVLTPTVVLNTADLQSFDVDCACQVDILSSSSEDWFESFLEYIDVTDVKWMQY